MSLKPRSENDKIKRAATQFAEKIVRGLEEAVESDRKNSALELGLPEDTTWEEINGLYKRKSVSKFRQIVGRQKLIDEKVGADMASSLEFMSKQYLLFMDGLTTIPEDRDAAVAVNRYFNELLAYRGKAEKLAEDLGGNPQISEMFDGINELLFQLSEPYLVFHNRFNSAQYPETFSGLLEQKAPK